MTYCYYSYMTNTEEVQITHGTNKNNKLYLRIILKYSTCWL